LIPAQEVVLHTDPYLDVLLSNIAQSKSRVSPPNTPELHERMRPTKEAKAAILRLGCAGSRLKFREM
jgi:hypothetical protein